jgi:hypothetical protein
VGGDLRERDEPEVRDAEEGVGDAGAGDVGGVEAEVFHDADGERVGSAGKEEPAVAADQLPESAARSGIDHVVLAEPFWGRGSFRG